MQQSLAPAAAVASNPWVSGLGAVASAFTTGNENHPGNAPVNQTSAPVTVGGLNVPAFPGSQLSGRSVPLAVWIGLALVAGVLVGRK